MSSFNNIPRRKLITAFLIGILVIILFGILTGILHFLYIYYLFSHNSVLEVQTTLKNPPFYFRFYTLLIGIFSYTLAGYFVGRKLKQKGWLYGAILGAIIFILGVFISFLPLFLPIGLIYGNNKVPFGVIMTLREKTLNNILASMPTNLLEKIFLTGIGGWLGERFTKKRN